MPATNQTEPPVVEFRNVTYSVPGMATRIISDLSVMVKRGETLVLLGESGCAPGRSTL